MISYIMALFFLQRGIKQLLVRNLPHTIRNYQIQDDFSKIGVIKEFYLPFDENNIHKGYALIEYSNPEDCLKASQKYNNKIYGGKYLKVLVLEEDPENSFLTGEHLEPRTEYIENEQESIETLKFLEF